MLKRDESSGQLTRLLVRCAEGTGATGIISGPVGFGKTALLEVLAKRAVDLGYTVLAAVGSRVERGFAYGVVEQLFQGAELAGRNTDIQHLLDRTEETIRLDPDLGTAQVMQACHRLLVALSADRPVVISVDDVQHADRESLECLLYLIRRCSRLPVGIVLAQGLPGISQCEDVLAELACRPGVLHVRLGALDQDDTARLISDRFTLAAAERYATDLFEISGGNPLLAQALVSDHAADMAQNDDESCRLTTGDMFRQASVACTRRSGPHGLLVARGIAIADGAAALPLLAQLVGLDKRVVEAAVKILTESRLIEGLSFRHSVIRAAVLDDMPAAERTRLHQKAGTLLRNAGAPAIAVAPHLIAGGSAMDEWAPQLLLDAAVQALGEDQVALATQCLQLADSCCGDPVERRNIKANLATIMWRDRPEAAARMLLALAGPARAAQLPGIISLKVTHQLLMHGRVTEAVALGGQLFAAQPTGSDDVRLALELDVARLWLAFSYPEVSKQLEAGLAPPTMHHQTPSDLSGRPRLSANHALWAVLKQGASDTLVAEAERALQRLPVEDETIDALNSAIMALIYADRLESAADWCDQMLTGTAGRRAPTWHARLTSTRAMIHLRQGSLRAAADSAETALRSMSEEAWGVEIGMPLATAIEAYTAIGDHAVSAVLVTTPVPNALFETRYGLHYLYARGRHYLATGYYDAALADFTLCGEKARAWDLDSPSLAPWRVGAVEVWLRRGQRERASKMADEHLALAKRAQRRTQGVALRVLAVTRPSSQRLELLGSALDMLQPTGDRYEMALTLVELCRTHQCEGAAAQARQIVRQAWRMAKECGADELRSSLMPQPAGSTQLEPRHLPSSDDKATNVLSEAELRVTSLAAQGYTNREISNKLFITVSTVEQHLTRVYRKLNIRHRCELPTSLAS